MAKILLVEDDNNLREIYEARLQAEGYTKVSAKDGEEALVVAKAERPDLVISDIMMPKISGFEMLDIMRNTDGLKDVKVIMLTALSQSDDQVRADKLGANRYLVKSQVTLEDIVKVAHDLLQDVPAPAASPEPAKPAAAETTSPVAAPVETPSPPTPPAEPTPVIAVATPPAETPAPATTPAPPTATPEVKPAPAEPAAAVPEPGPPASLITNPAAEPSPSVSSTPTPPSEPVTPPEPVASPDQPAATPPATAKTGSVAQSTAQEEASVEAQIEDFVVGATTEAPGPNQPALSATTPTEDKQPGADAAAAPVTAAATVAPTGGSASAAPSPAGPATPPAAAEPSQVITPTSDSAGAANASDDKLMAEAIKTLTADSGGDTPADKTATAPEVASTPDAKPQIITNAKSATSPPAAGTPNIEIDGSPEETPKSEAEEAGSSSDISGGDTTQTKHRKVITPIDSKPKEDIQALLAQEEAKQAATQGPPRPTAIVATAETGAKPTPLATSDSEKPAATEFATNQAQAAANAPPAEADNSEASQENPVNPNSIAL